MLPFLGVEWRKGNVKRETKRNPLPYPVVRGRKGNVKRETKRNRLPPRSSREPALRALSPAAQVVRFDKDRKEANGLTAACFFFLSLDHGFDYG